MKQVKNLSKTFSKICTPAQLYFLLGVITIISSLTMRMSITQRGINIIILLVWTFILNFICTKGWNSLSWFLVLFPYILLLGSLILLRVLMKEGFGSCGKEEKK